jgi:CheY-like chemotaxis protein
MKRILVVDGEPAIRTLFSRLLSGMGYQVITASSGVAALGAAASDSIELVVTDYQMSDMNAHDSILELRAQHSGLKTLVVTGCPPDGADDRSWWVDQPSLAKPFSTRSLRDAVVALIGPL